MVKTGQYLPNPAIIQKILNFGKMRLLTLAKKTFFFKLCYIDWAKKNKPLASINTHLLRRVICIMRRAG